MSGMVLNMILWNVKSKTMIQECNNNEIAFQKAFRLIVTIWTYRIIPKLVNIFLHVDEN